MIEDIKTEIEDLTNEEIAFISDKAGLSIQTITRPICSECGRSHIEAKDFHLKLFDPFSLDTFLGLIAENDITLNSRRNFIKLVVVYRYHGPINENSMVLEVTFSHKETKLLRDYYGNQKALAIATTNAFLRAKNHIDRQLNESREEIKRDSREASDKIKSAADKMGDNGK